MQLLTVTPTESAPTVVIKPSRAATLLAALLVHAGHVASYDYLNALLWGGYVPTTARASLHTYISRLRRLLSEVGCDPSIVETVAGGYRIRADAEDVDLLRFETLTTRAQEALDTDCERDLLDAALALVPDGEALLNVPSPQLQSEVRSRVESQWARAAERSIVLRLAAGETSGLEATLRAALRRHPDQVRLSELLVETLWRSGDRVAALRMHAEVGHYYRTVLEAEPDERFEALGVQLRAAKCIVMLDGPSRSDETLTTFTVVDGIRTDRIVTTDTTGEPERSDPGGAGVATAGEGAGSTGLLSVVGRDAERQALREHLHHAGSVVVVTGPPGCGKSALAAQVAADRGAVRSAIVPLRTPAGAARCPGELRDELLELLFADGGSDFDHAEDVLVLDDAASAEQVKAVLAVVGSVRVVITSRHALPEIAISSGALVCRLGPVAVADSLELLRRALGDPRLRREPDAARAIAEACAGLPLAVRIVGARLAQRPRQSLVDFLAALRADPEANLAVVAGSGPSYFAAAEAFFDCIDRELLAAFAIVVDRADNGGATAAQCGEWFDADPRRTHVVMDRLVNWSLVDEVSPGRYVPDPLLSRVARHRPGAPVRPADTRAAELPVGLPRLEEMV